MLKLVREAQAAQQLIVHHPVLLKLDCVQKWVETGNWSHTGLLRHKDTNETLTVKKNKQRFFMYQEQGREHFLHDTKSEQEFITMSFGEFLNNVKAQKDSPAWYFTSQVQNLSPSLQTSLDPEIYDMRVEGPPQSAGIWLGGLGSCTIAHYDVFNNIFMQMHGRKRVKLWPPQYFHEFHVYPDAHPRARKTQVNPDSVDYELFPLYESLPPPTMDVELGPGDSLYIPAFWFHSVEVIESGLSDDNSSASVNVFSQSLVTLEASGILNCIPVFPNDTAPTVNKLSRLMKLIKQTLEPIYPNASCDFITKMKDSRYEPLWNLDDKSFIGNFDEAGGNVVSQQEGRRIFETEFDTTPFDYSKMSSILHRLDDLRKSLKDAPSEQVEGMVNLTIAHLVEIFCVRCVGPQKVHYALRKYPELFDRIL